MSQLERINKLEDKIMNMENNINNLNNKYTNLNQSLDILLSIDDKLNILLHNNSSQNNLNNSQESMEISEFANEDGSLNNIKNPFIIESKKFEKINNKKKKIKKKHQ